jgi:16S rRNA (adenine1518-N6/adenine1519-N6)-dimethyltransferase
MKVGPGAAERIRPKKRFGQHFLASGAVARRIVDAAGITADDSVLEIGPGRGILTDLMAERAGRLVAVELDRHLARELAARYQGRPNVRIVQADFLEVDPLCLGLTGGSRMLAVANLPYNVSVPILEKLLAPPAAGPAGPVLFAKLVVMVQREVAVRMGVGPGSKDYGSLSVFMQTKAEVQRLFDVRPGSFVPPPKVVSTVVELRPLVKPTVPESESADFHRFVRACFGYRRKTLGAGLRQALKTDSAIVSEIGKLGGMNLGRRAESLSIDELITLFRNSQKALKGRVPSGERKKTPPDGGVT